ncbi:MAG: hypothetical protein H7Y08_10300 [Rhizobiaceae bacterium]|nr:hypothetical protein [Rhizobiaceae bacterium]
MKTAIAILILALLGGATLVVVGGAAMAQSIVPGPNAAPAGASTPSGRFEMQPVEGGIARLDTMTGEVSFCRLEASRMTCQQSEEDRERLEARIRELSGPVAVVPEGRVTPLAPRAAPPASDRTAEDEEIDRAIDRMKQVFRAFRDIAREFEEAPEPADPNRT